MLGVEILSLRLRNLTKIIRLVWTQTQVSSLFRERMLGSLLKLQSQCQPRLQSFKSWIGLTQVAFVGRLCSS